MKGVLEFRALRNSQEYFKICLHGHHIQTVMCTAKRLYMNKLRGEIALACRSAEYCETGFKFIWQASKIALQVVY